MIYDINTKNLSFLKMSANLKSKGVKNNKFMLKLYDESLVGVDPFDPNLTIDQKAKIFCEISKNYWYFLREVCMVNVPGNNSGVHFQLHLGNCALSYCNNLNINNIVVLPRQIGKTVAEVAFSLWTACFSASFSKESYLHKNQDGSNSNLSKFKEMKSLLPKWLIEFLADPNDKDNITIKYIGRNHNEIQAMSSASNDAAAEKIGRGSSTPLVYCDEFAFLERNQKIFNALVPAWYKSATVAKSNHAPYGIRITTTPNTLTLPQAAYCYSYINNALKFTYQFYDIPVDSLSSYVKKNSGNDFVFIKYDWKEMELGREWYEAQLRAMNHDVGNAKRELDCIWPEATGDGVFVEEQLDRIKAFVKPPVFTLNVDGYDINFFEKIDFEMNYIISCDVASGSSLDRSVMLIIHPEDFRVVGLFMNARIDTDSFKNLILHTATQYLFHAVINIENNSYGKNILDALMKIESVEPRLYRETAKRQAEKTLSDGQVIKQTKQRIIYGTSTNSTSRNEMMSILMQVVDESPEVFVSSDFYDELRNLTRYGNKIEARKETGIHDDIVMSYLITRYAIAFGRCFQEKFHINMLPSKSNVHTGSGTSASYGFFTNLIDTANGIDYDDGAYIDSNNIQNTIKYIRDINKKDQEQGYFSEESDDSFLDNVLSWNNDDYDF